MMNCWELNNSKFDKDPSSGFINQGRNQGKPGVSSEYSPQAPLKVVIDVDKRTCQSNKHYSPV